MYSCNQVSGRLRTPFQEACRIPLPGSQGKYALTRELRRSPRQFRCSSSRASLSSHAYHNCYQHRHHNSGSMKHPLVLEPYLNRPLSHAYVLGYALANCGCWCRVFDKFIFQCDQLILCGSLPFLVLLLLGEGALARRTTRIVIGRGTNVSGGNGGRGGRSRHDGEEVQSMVLLQSVFSSIDD